MRRVDERVLDAPVLRKLHEELVRAAVHRVREDRMVARLESRHESCCDRRHARREEHATTRVARPDAFECGELARGALVGRRAPPAVHVAIAVGIRRLLLLVQPRAVGGAVEHKGGAQHDGERDGVHSTHRKVGDLDDRRASRRVAVGLPVLARCADWHAGADRRHALVLWRQLLHWLLLTVQGAHRAHADTGNAAWYACSPREEQHPRGDLCRV